MSNKISLVEIKGATDIYIDTEITDAGDLVFSGQDIGDAPEAIFGDSDYEYWLTIEKQYKDRVLLALIEKLYSGNASVITEMRKYLESKGIPCNFSSF